MSVTLQGGRTSGGPERSLRADARRNKDRLIKAALNTFAAQGLDAPLQRVADRAGVGIGTLYRHFGTRQRLIAACFETKLDEYLRTLEHALARDDPWEGFCEYVQLVCSMQAAQQGLSDVLTMRVPKAPALDRRQADIRLRFAKLVRQAQVAGKLRSDFQSDDMILIWMANGGVVQATREAAPTAWKRFAALMIDAVRAERAHPLPPLPPPAQIQRAMRRASR